MIKEIVLRNIKDSDIWMELTHDLKWNQFKKENPNLNEDELSDKFYEKVVHKYFYYGEYANILLQVDENFNIVGGKFIK